jgi:hypothetical protein
VPETDCLTGTGRTQSHDGIDPGGSTVYVLVAIARKRLGLEKGLILQIFSITSLEKVPILQVFEAFDSQSKLLDNSN